MSDSKSEMIRHQLGILTVHEQQEVDRRKIVEKLKRMKQKTLGETLFDEGDL